MPKYPQPYSLKVKDEEARKRLHNALRHGSKPSSRVMSMITRERAAERRAPMKLREKDVQRMAMRDAGDFGADRLNAAKAKFIKVLKSEGYTDEEIERYLEIYEKEYRSIFEDL